MAKKLKVLFSNNSAWSVYNFRTRLLNRIKVDLNAEIAILCPFDERYTPLLEKEGFKVFSINFQNNDTSIKGQLNLLRNYFRLYKLIAPDIILHNAVTPNIYGTIAASRYNIPVINNVSGLGSSFIKGGITWGLIKYLYKFSQKRASHIFFQNEDDQLYFTDNILSKRSNYSLIPGSGVDLSRFNPKNRRFDQSNTTKFCFVGRLIKDKGINEFIEVAKAIKTEHPAVEFNIIGALDENQISGIAKSELQQWIDSGLITYQEKTDKIEDVLGDFDTIVLPSYREGLARVLIEAASTGIPLVTTNVPGCYQTVIDGKSGYLCAEKDSNDLKLAIVKVLSLTKEERIRMGDEGRKLMEDKFDESIVIEEYKLRIKELVSN